MSGSRRLFIRGGRVVCPAGGRDEAASVIVEGDEILAIEPPEVDPGSDDRVLDATGLVVAPGFIDLHAHLGEPGEEYKEDLETGTRAAVRGGFTSVVVSPATDPVCDNRAMVEYLTRRGRELGAARVLPIAGLTRGLGGERLTDMLDAAACGAVAFGDGDHPVRDPGLLRRALEYARGTGKPVFEWPEDPALAGAGVMHEGAVATRLGLRGTPAAAEDVVVLRDIALAEQTGARVHIGPVSTVGAVRGLRMAKAAGIPVTSAVSAAHLHLTDEEIAAEYHPNLRVRPPLRPKADRDALRAALADGTIDAVTSNHRAQSLVEKEVEFDLAAPGMIGLETTLGLVMKLVQSGVVELSRAVALLTAGPAAALGIDAGRLRPGGAADIVVFDPDARQRVESASLASRCRNTPFLGRALPGRVAWTIVGGRVTHTAEGGDR